MSRAMVEPDPHEAVTIAILAKAPVPGHAKTRLIPALGAHGAAALQDRLIADTLMRARAAGLGPIDLWANPDASHPAFAEAALADPALTLLAQVAGDLGAKMLAAARRARPILIIGTDCPALSPGILRSCAEALHGEVDVVIVPAHDGGYVLIGMNAPQPALFSDIDWGTAQVMAQTRARLDALRVRVREFPPLWDIDEPDDLTRLDARWQAEGFAP